MHFAFYYIGLIVQNPHPCKFAEREFFALSAFSIFIPSHKNPVFCKKPGDFQKKQIKNKTLSTK